jgi:hypothetical protein
MSRMHQEPSLSFQCIDTAARLHRSLHTNQLSGAIPESIGNMTSLKHLYDACVVSHLGRSSQPPCLISIHLPDTCTITNSQAHFPKRLAICSIFYKCMQQQYKHCKSLTLITSRDRSPPSLSLCVCVPHITDT